MKIIAITPKQEIKNKELIEKLERLGAIFYENDVVDLLEVNELFDEEDKLLAIDDIRIDGGQVSLNKILPKTKNIKYICSLSSRHHGIELKLLKILNITYCNNPDTTSESVAQLGIMMMFMLIRKQPLTLKNSFDFYGVNSLGRECQQLSVGVLGYGNIESKIARICDALSMSVQIWSRSKKKSKFKQVELEELLSNEIIFMALPDCEETRALFTDNLYKSLHPDQYIVDITANDNLHDKNRLIKMVNNRQLLGFGFEAQAPSSRYIKQTGNIVMTPHIGWATEEGYFRMYKGWVDTILSYLEGKPVNEVCVS